MSVGNKAVISCDVSRGVITSNVLSVFKHQVKGQVVHFVPFCVRLEVPTDLSLEKKKDTLATGKMFFFFLFQTQDITNEQIKSSLSLTDNDQR